MVLQTLYSKAWCTVEIQSLLSNIYSQVVSILEYQHTVAHVTHLHDSSKCKLAHFLIELLLQACGQLCSSSAFGPLCRCWSAPYSTATALMMPAGLIAAHSGMLSQHTSLEQSRHSTSSQWAMQQSELNIYVTLQRIWLTDSVNDVLQSILAIVCTVCVTCTFHREANEELDHCILNCPMQS